MISTRTELRRFIKADRKALGSKTESGFRFWRCFLFPSGVEEFQFVLRKLEYLAAKNQNVFNRVRKLLTYRKYIKLSYQMGFSIPPNVFGPGLSIAHRGTIVVNKGARVGANCRLHACVNIGTQAGKSHAAPTIGNNVYIGPGAKIYGNIVIADGCAIGANAVVNKSFLELGSVIAGVPARKVGEVDTKTLLIKGVEV